MKKPFRKLKLYLLWATGMFIVLTLALFLSIHLGAFGPMPGRQELQSIKHETATLILSNEGELLGKIFASNRTKIRGNQLPDHLIHALVSTEDKRFFEHSGIDMMSYLRVIFKNLIFQDRSAGGGSTITQQIIKNLYGRKELGLLTLPVSKIREAIIASRIEKIYTKEELLILYLNSVPFGENLWGIEAAAQRFFSKETAQLSVTEAAVLVGLLKANTFYNPRLNPNHALNRRNTVLKLMHQQGYLSIHDYAVFKSRPLGLRYKNILLENPAGYFIRQVELQARDVINRINETQNVAWDIEKDGLIIQTTLNYDLQLKALSAIERQLKKMQPLLRAELESKGFRRKWEQQLSSAGQMQALQRQALETDVFQWSSDTKPKTHMDSLWHYYSMLHAAFLAIEPKSGKVVVWIGGNHFRYLPFDLINAERPAASTIKPVLYAAAFEQGFTPCDYLDNQVKVYEAYDDWQPTNYDGSEGKPVAAWYALSQSKNLPAVDLYLKLDKGVFSDQCTYLGLPGPPENQPATALGVMDVSLNEMVEAYTAFANEGRRAQPVMIDKILDPKGKVLYSRPSLNGIQSVSAATARQITDILRIAVNEGTGKGLRSRFEIKADLAGKTGTSQNFSDALFICYTENLVMGVRVGALSPEVHFNSGANGSGSALALPIAGYLLQEMEASSSLSATYLTGFPFDIKPENIDCPPERHPALTGRIIDNMFGNKNDSSSEVPGVTAPGDTTTAEKGSKIGNFFRKLLGGKKKKKKDDVD